MGPFLERPGNLTGPESDFDIKVSRKVGRVLTPDDVHFVSLADNFTVQVSNLFKLPLEWKTKQLNEPGNYRELRETGPKRFSSCFKTVKSSWILPFWRPDAKTVAKFQYSIEAFHSLVSVET